jgi:hypothetical protein
VGGSLLVNEGGSFFVAVKGGAGSLLQKDLVIPLLLTNLQKDGQTLKRIMLRKELNIGLKNTKSLRRLFP